MAAQQSIRMGRKTDIVSIYSKVIITRKIHVNIKYVGENIKQTLEKIITSDIEGKCIVEGFIKPMSTKILTYSSGEVNGANITFEVVFECLVCSPVEGMHIKCIAKNITKAGIRAETDEEPSPVVIFIARDHHNTSKYFATVKSNDTIKVRVIGQRFELNDKYISIIAELLESKETKPKIVKKPRLVIKQ
jgi:DNA-directed RNA polymerase subunit E'/Rpb7